MSYLLDQIKRASVNEAADILAAKYVESMEKKSGITKSADPQSASLYGAAAGAGVGGLGTLGLDYLSGRGVNARRALSGALIGALPGAAAGALADAYATPAAKDPKDPPSSPSLTIRKALNFFSPLKVPRDLEEAASGAAGAGAGWWGGSKINNILPRSWGVFNSDADLGINRNSLFSFLNTRNLVNENLVKKLNRDSASAFVKLRDAKTILDSATAAGNGVRKAQDAFNIANAAYDDVGKKMPEIVRTPEWHNRATKGIFERPSPVGGTTVDPQKYTQVASGRSYILPAIGAILGYGGAVSANRAVSEPLHNFFSRRATDDVE